MDSFGRVVGVRCSGVIRRGWLAVPAVSCPLSGLPGPQRRTLRRPCRRPRRRPVRHRPPCGPPGPFPCRCGAAATSCRPPRRGRRTRRRPRRSTGGHCPQPVTHRRARRTAPPLPVPTATTAARGTRMGGRSQEGTFPSPPGNKATRPLRIAVMTQGNRPRGSRVTPTGGGRHRPGEGAIEGPQKPGLAAAVVRVHRKTPGRGQRSFRYRYGDPV
jgi:hypothetical protein